MPIPGDCTIQPMQGVKKERWMELCEQAASEQDSKKLHEIILEIDRLLAEKEARIKASYREAPKP